jgi:arginase
MTDAVTRRIEVIGVPLDLGAGLRGVDVGPSAMRHAGLVGRLRSLGYETIDAGNVLTPVADTVLEGSPVARYAMAVDEVCQKVRAAVASAIRSGAVPLVLGGDHSIAAGSLAGIIDERASPRVLWIDAHADLNTPETTPSGNVHGMPLAAALGAAATVFPNLGWRDRSISPAHVVLVGLRSLDPGERELIRRLNLTAFTMADIDRVGIYDVIERALERLDATAEQLHVTFDLDVMDPAVAPGVGTPVPGGMTVREAHLAMELIAQSGTLGSMEAVEVNAIRDHENQTGRLAVDLILSAFGQTIL